MKSDLKLSVIVFGLLLSACAQVSPPSRSEIPSGALSAAAIPTGATAAGAVAIDPSRQIVLAAQYDVAAVEVRVPRQLRVSEANLFYPVADIVWHGEALADRHAQVQAIFAEAAANATAPMTRGRAVLVDFEVARFHSVTAKARYTVGGVHNVKFIMTVRDAASGEVLDGPREVVADAKASGGARAIAEDEAGRTQRVVIVEMLTQALRRELSAPVVLQPGEALVARAGGGASVVPAALQ